MSREVTATLVLDLRKRTGVGMSKCKEALIESDGNLEEAITILRKKGVASAVKKSVRATKEGVIGYAQDTSALYLVEINVETDFVLKNERFNAFLQGICHQALVLKPSSVEDFLERKCSESPELTIDEYRTEIVHALGENIQIKRVLGFEKTHARCVGVYSHMGGKIVSAVVIEGGGDQGAVAREVSLHVAAESPSFISQDEIPAAVLENEREIAFSQIQNKPIEIQEKIVQNKLNAYYEQVCLLNQKYVKDPSMTIEQFVKKAANKVGKPLRIVQFVRWQVGA